jgi:hypothetical protein
LYCFWHGGFALLVLAYAVLANIDGGPRRVANIPAGILVAVLLTQWYPRCGSHERERGDA